MRTTAFTFFAEDGEDAFLVTVREDGGRYRMLTNPGDVDAGDPRDYRYRGVGQTRRRLMALVRADGRRSAAAASAFIMPVSALTDTRGGTGRTMTFEEAIARVLTYSAEEYRGETAADRQRDADAILAQRDW